MPPNQHLGLHLTRVFLGLLATVSPAHQCTLHVDGAYSVEKAHEHARRGRDIDGEFNKLESLIERVEARSQTGKKSSKATWLEMERWIWRTFHPTEVDRVKLMEGLRIRFSVCQCISETDLYIARLPPHGGRRITVIIEGFSITTKQLRRSLAPSRGLNFSTGRELSNTRSKKDQACHRYFLASTGQLKLCAFWESDASSWKGKKLLGNSFNF